MLKCEIQRWRIGTEEVKMLHFLTKYLVTLVLHLLELVSKHRGSLNKRVTSCDAHLRYAYSEERLFPEGRTDIHVGQFVLRQIFYIWFYCNSFYLFIIKYIIGRQMFLTMILYELEFNQILSHES